MKSQIRTLFEHRIVSGSAALKWLADDLSAFPVRKYVILCDTNTAGFCLPLLLREIPVLDAANVVVVPDGESSKTIDQAISLWKELTLLGIGRKDMLINLGGGMITDLGGFVAANYLRGIPFIHVPTSLLAQVDAALGGKTGVDLEHAKNRVGLTAFPEAVYCWPGFFSTLPAVEWESACGEVVKHALLSGRGLWTYFRAEGLTSASVISGLTEVQEVKLKVVEMDPYERGVRKTLNLGHTIGHAVESEFLTQGSPLPHGLAVALGLLLESEIAAEMGLLDPKVSAEITACIRQWFVLPDISQLDTEHLIAWMRMDKKNEEDKLLFSLLADIGACSWNVSVDVPLIRRVLEKYRNG